MNVHELKPGDIGLVAHTMKHHELNAWGKRLLINPKQSYTRDLMFEGDLYMLEHHISHGTLVLILSEHALRSDKMPYYRYYRILWDEHVLFIRQELVLNPYVNEQTP